MLTQERHAYLLRLLGETGRLVARDISHALGLSEDTIRRDLRQLAKAGRLRRVHGGAVPIAQADARFDQREAIATPEKIQIGRHVARMIQPGQVVFLDGGTTARQVARQMPQGLRATVITHSPNVALDLMVHDGLTIDLVGGRLFRHSVVTCGAATLAWLDRFRPDLCLIGATGLHPEAGVTTGDSDEAEVKRRVIAQSAEAVVLASSEKLGAVSAFQVADWDDIDGIVVAPSDAERAGRLLSGLSCDLHLAGA